MNHKLTKITFTGLLVLGIQAHAATTALIDFGRAANSTGNPSGGLYYNNVELNTIDSGNTGSFTLNGAGTSLSLIDSTNLSTGWTVSVSKISTGGGAGTAGAGGDYAGATPVSVSSYAATALQDGCYVNNGGVVRVTFSGLSAGFTYDLVTYGARGSSGSNETWELVSGTSSDPAQVAINVLNNTSNAPTWTGITANGSGEISFEFRANSTSSGTVSQLNFVSLSATAIPEPSSLALVGLAGFGFIMRRRR